MSQKSFPLWSALALLLAAGACSKSTPTAPSGGTATTDTSVTLGAPQAVTPADGALFKNVQQPVTLVASNGVTTGGASLAYTFEVSTDAGFGSIVYRKDSVSEGAGGRTIVTIDRLAPDRKYFWRTRGNPGANSGPNSRVRSFTIGPEVILQTPVTAAPTPNALVSGGTVTLTVNNVGRSGLPGVIFYRFDLSDSSSFANTIFSTTVPEQFGGHTSVTLPSNLQLPRGTYYWRVQATDPENEVTTNLSSVVSFSYQPFDMHQAVILDNPGDLASWAETTHITSVDMSNYIVVDFDKRQSGDKWPQSGFGDGGIQYTLGMCFNLGGQWYCSAAIQFWDGRELEAGGLASEVAINWYYDSRWGPMAGHQPAPGEIVGIFVAQGNLRDNGNTSVRERSDVVLVPFGGFYVRGQ